MKPSAPFHTPVVADAPQRFAEQGARSVPALASVTPSSLSTQRVLNSQQLFGAANELLIDHAGFTYRLRITQANKLILTK